MSGVASPSSVAAGDATSKGPIVHRSCHIVEDPGGIAHVIDVDVPTEYYYEAYAKDLLARHPKANVDVHDD